MTISAKCENCLNLNKDCKGMASYFTGCVYYKDENDKRIFDHYKNRLAEGGKTRFGVVQYLCSFPQIKPYDMAAALIIDGCEVVFDDSSISIADNKAHERAVMVIVKEQAQEVAQC